MSDIRYMKAVEFDKLPSLFKKTFPLLALGPKGYWLQRKYDGCFGAATVTPFRKDCRMASREGKDYSTSCASILDALHTMCLNAWGDDFCESVVFLGEAWMPKTKFPDISGRFRRQTKGPQDLMFVMNDMLPLSWETDDTYSARFADLWRVYEERGISSPELAVAETFEQWDDTAGPMPHAVRWQNEGGFDGAILRNPSAGYTFGLVKQGEIIKVKPLLELDLHCLGYQEDVGAKTGRAVYTIDVVYRGVITRVGSGAPHKLADMPRAGQIVRIDSLGLTEAGALREPRYIGIRYDKDTPDA